MRKYSEFSEGVTKALNEYQNTRARELKEKVKRSVEDYAVNGAIESWTKITDTYDGDGNLISTAKTTTTVRRPAPWAIERVLGKNCSELEAIKKLVDSDWIETDKLVAIEKLLDSLNEEIKSVLKG